MIVGVFTELLPHGGVQRLGRHMATSLALHTTANAIPIKLLSLNDPAGMHEVSVGTVNLRFEGMGRRHAALLLRLARMARATRLLYINHPFIAPLALPLRLVNRRLRHAVHLHGIEVWQPLSPIRRLALQRASFITTTSVYTLNEAARIQSAPAERMFPLYPPLDPGMRAVPADAAAPCPHPYILSVSRLARTEAGKHLREAITAFAKSAPPEWHYVIVGDGDAREDLQRHAREAGAGERVHFPGRLNDDALRAAYRDCEFFLLPSAKEGFGIVFLEAMIHGRPSIGGDAGGTPEVVCHGRTGLLVKPGCIDSIGSAISRLAQSPADRESMGNAAREEVRRLFLFERFHSRLSALVAELLASSPA